jgi:serine/threonine protein kinase
LDDPDKPKWEKLYLRAQELFKHTQNPWMPETGEDTIDDREELEKYVNEQLEEALDQEWQKYLDRIRAKENNLYLPGELQYAEMQRPVLMRMFREGQAPPWPPAPRTTAAEDIAAGLGSHEERAGWGPWQFFQEIGRGAQGSAALWTSARFGDHGMIGEVCIHLHVQQGLCQACPLMLRDIASQDFELVDAKYTNVSRQRIIVKDLDLMAQWADDKRWIKNDFTGNDRWIRERAMHAQLSSVGRAHNIVEHLGSTTYTNKRSLRLYMEYCPHGDLADLLCKHAKFDRANKGLMLDDNDEPVPEVKIPVRALWTFFRDLATAAFILHLGHNPLDSGAQEAANWTEIIHRDIKPGNIFLAAPLSKTGRGIPVCKLGDFGLAVPPEYLPLRNPEDMCHAGTRGWRAPEQQLYEDAEHRRKLSSATNIWEIGRIMLALVELTHGEWPKQLAHVLFGGENDGRVSVEVDKKFSFLEEHAVHGPMLYNFIAECLEPVPQDRVTAEDLLRRIHSYIDSPLVGLPDLEQGDVLEYSHDLRWAS